MEDEMNRFRGIGMDGLISFLAFMLSISILWPCCKKAPHLKPGYVSLERCVSEYHDCIRWRDYEGALVFIVPEEKDKFREFSERIEGKLCVEDYKVIKVTRDKENIEADILVKRSYTLLPSVTLKEEKLSQHWVLKGKSWFLTGPPF
jgi:hypothetical protein